jgi:hypothetical protein
MVIEERERQTSAMEFWMGVPVSSSRLRHENERRLFQRADDALLIA